MAIICKDEIRYLQNRRRDDVGEIFEYDGRILRGIFLGKVDMVREMFSSGFVSELISKKLIPNTWITEDQCERYGLILEHDRISQVVYPQEWTFSMLKDAALCVLDVAEIARSYGYNMKDCHGLNVLFSYGRPLYIDIGSFHRNRQGVSAWEPYSEFLRFYMYPLLAWSDGLEFTAKLSIFSGHLTTHRERLIYRFRFLRLIHDRYLDRLLEKCDYFPNIARMSQAELRDIVKNKSFVKRFLRVKLKQAIDWWGGLPNQNLSALKLYVSGISRRESNSMWKDYHTNIRVKNKRFDKIVQLINTFCPDAKCAVDIAGNQGMFSRELLTGTKIERSICQDYDEQAVDIGYNMLKESSAAITHVAYNVMEPIAKLSVKPPNERFQSDIVCSLALLHHLILGQGYSLPCVLQILGSYSRKYVCIEFMPKGLWTATGNAPVNVPDWYTVEWFRDEFTKRFRLLKEEQTEENYIVFIGEKY